MPIELKMPALSPTMEEGTLAKWLVKEGDTVASGDIMAEIETDKATMEFEAVDEGTIAKILIQEGTDEVRVGAVIAILAEEGEDVEEAAASAGKSGGSAKSEDAKVASEPGKNPEDPNDDKLSGSAEDRREGDRRQEDKGPPEGKERRKGDRRDDDDDDAKAPAAPVSESGERVKASPLARRIAAQKGVDLTGLDGSGPKGRIVKADVEGAQPSAKAPAAKPDEAKSAAPATAQGEFQTDIPHEAEKLSNMRKTIARRLTEAKQTIPHIYLTVDIQLDKLLKLRSELNSALEPQGIKLSVNDLLVKALAKALIQVPKCNVSFAGNQLISYSRADISVAVSTPAGLITPIVVGADTKSLSAISTEVKELAGRAKEGKLKPEEYQGGTASISNMGMFGIKQFDAVINPPQGMILAIGAGEKRPYIVDDALSVATVMSATGSFDHRAIDGADGAKLMQALKKLVENPLAMVA